MHQYNKNKIDGLDIKYQPLRTKKSTDKQGSFGREITVFQGSFLILCLITIIGLSLLPNVSGLAKVEKDVASGNDTSVYNRGPSLDILMNHTGAILYYDKALSIDPKNVLALTSKGLALHALGNYTGAIQYYDKALSIDPKDVAALTDKGLALHALGNYTGAIQYYGKALSIDPHYIRALTDKGLALDKLGNYTGAIQYYDKALSIVIDPHDVNALTDKGLDLHASSAYNRATTKSEQYRIVFCCN